jgi:hypothetical protein
VAEADGEFRAFVRFITAFLQSLRRTIEIPFEAQLRQKNAAADLLREILRDVESARLSIAPIRMNITRERQQSISDYLAQLSNELRRLCSNSDYVPVLKSVRFRMLPAPPPRIRDKTDDDWSRFGEGFTAYEAIQSALDKIDAFANPPGASDRQRDGQCK